MINSTVTATLEAAWMQCGACQGSTRAVLMNDSMKPLMAAAHEHAHTAHPDQNAVDLLALRAGHAAHLAEASPHDPVRWLALWNAAYPPDFGAQAHGSLQAVD